MLGAIKKNSSSKRFIYFVFQHWALLLNISRKRSSSLKVGATQKRLYWCVCKETSYGSNLNALKSWCVRKTHLITAALLFWKLKLKFAFSFPNLFLFIFYNFYLVILVTFPNLKQFTYVRTWTDLRSSSIPLLIRTQVMLSFINFINLICESFEWNIETWRRKLWT